MSTILTFILIGLGACAAYAGISLGIVMTYKGTGVINFAAGAIAAWGAFVFDELRRHGELWLPIVLGRFRGLARGGGSGNHREATLGPAAPRCARSFDHRSAPPWGGESMCSSTSVRQVDNCFRSSRTGSTWEA